MQEKINRFLVENDISIFVVGDTVTNHAICVNSLSRQRPVNTLNIRLSSYFRLREQNVSDSQFLYD